jgi:septal ring factor EnvC (AmiA/AmiB activator)
MLKVAPLLVALALGAGVQGPPAQAPQQAPAAQAPDAAQIEAARARAQALTDRANTRMQQLQREADALASQERTLLVELRQLEVQRDLKAAEVARVNATLAATLADITRTEGQTRQLEATVARQKPAIRARLVELYKLGRPGYWRLLLNVNDLRAVGEAYRSVSELSRQDQLQIAEHRRTLAALAQAQQALAAKEAETRRLRAKAQAARQALTEAAEARQARLDQIDAQRDLAAQLTGELQVARTRLQTALAEIARGNVPHVSLPLKPFRGDLDWPVAGRVVAPFGGTARARTSQAIQRNGVEIEAPEGTSVRAIHGGTVAYADAFTGYGYLVIIDHGNNAYSLYGYLGALSVHQGEPVERHAVLGAVGRPPTDASPRLYFEIRVDGQPVDPVQWLKHR